MAKDRPVVLVLSTAEDISGGEIFLLSLFAKMTWWKAVLVTPNPDLMARCRAQGNEAILVPNLRSLRREYPLRALWRLLICQPLALGKLFGIARKHRAKVILSNAYSTAHLAFVLSKFLKIPALWSHQHPIFKPGNRDARICGWFLTQGGMKAIACSEAVAASFGEIGRDRSSVAVITNNIDPVHFQRTTPAFKGKPQIVVGLIAMITPWKGMDLLVDAALLLKKRGVTADRLVLRIYGGIHENRTNDRLFYESLLQKIDHLGLQNQVFFCGKKQEMREIYEDLDVVVNCSIEPEPFGISIVEAMSMECVVIVPNAGGPAEIVRDGEDGFFFRSGSSESLADKLEYVADHYESLAELRKRARGTVCRRFSATDMAAGYEEIFTRLSLGKEMGPGSGP